MLRHSVLSKAGLKRTSLPNAATSATPSVHTVPASSHALLSRRTVVSRAHVVATSGDSPFTVRRDSRTSKEPSQPFVWTCNLCQASSRQSSMRKLTGWRSNHIAYVHKAERPRVNKIKSTLTVIVATMLPWHLTSWVCSQCDKGLPNCDSCDQLRKSARAHLQTHSRKDQKCLTLKENWQRLCKKHHPRTVEYATAGQRKGQEATRCRLDDKFGKIATDSGHALSRMMSVMRKQRPGTSPFLSMSWSTLRVSWTDGNSSVPKRETSPKKVAAAWKLSRQQITTLEMNMQAMIRKTSGKLPNIYRSWKRSLVEDGDVEENPGPTTTVSCLNTQVHSIVEGKLPFMLGSWQRCLTEEGVEPNPRASSLITNHSLNVDGKHKAWKFMNQFAAERKEVAILQEVNLNKEEQVLFANAWNAQGYSVYFPDNVKIALTVGAVHNSLRSRRVWCCSTPCRPSCHCRNAIWHCVRHLPQPAASLQTCS